MELREFTNPIEFQTRVVPFLEEREAENNLLLGIVARLAKGGIIDPATGEPPFLCLVEDEGRILAVAVRTPPHRLVLSRAPAIPIAMIADYLARKRSILPGVVGPLESAETFITAWKKLSPQPIRPARAMRIYQLQRVNRLPTISGALEEASVAELQLLIRWHKAFADEIGETSHGDERPLVESALAEHRLFLWKDPYAVSMAAYTRPTAHGVCINMVYTPPPLRGRGYATATVAALSHLMLQSGRRFCCLFTDLDNPTTNDIYPAIGYQPVADFQEFHFDTAPAT